MKKLTASVIILAIILSFSGGVFVNKVKAGETESSVAKKMAIAGAACYATSIVVRAVIFGVSYVVSMITDIFTPKVPAGETTGALDNWFQKALDDGNKCIRDVLVKALIDYVVDQTVAYIQGNGDSKFFSNFDLNVAADHAFDRVVKNVGAAGLCSPFGLQIRLGLLPVPRFSQQITCTLDRIVSNIDNFYVDFSVGGWAGYNAMWEPQNNYYGTILAISDEMMKKTAEEKEKTKNEMAAGGGFKSDKQCKAGSSQNNNISAGSKISLAIDSCVEAYDDCKFKNEAGDLGGKDFKICGETKSSCINSAMDKGAKDNGYVKDSKGKFCDPKDLEIITPGSTAGLAVSNALKLDGDWAVNVQSWTAAIANAVVNRFTKEGLKYMKDSVKDDKKKNDYDPASKVNNSSNNISYISSLVSDYNSKMSSLNNIITVKNNTLGAISSSAAMLSDLNTYTTSTIAIPPLSNYCAYNPYLTYTTNGEVSTTTITLATKIINANLASSTITSDIIPFQAAYDTASSSVAYANSITDFSDSTVLTKIQNDRNNFYTTYSATLSSLITAKSSADTNYTYWLNNLTDITTVYNSCSVAVVAGKIAAGVLP